MATSSRTRLSSQFGPIHQLVPAANRPPGSAVTVVFATEGLSNNPPRCWPLSVTATGGRQARQGAESGNIYDHFSATFEYPNNVKGFHMSRQMVGCAFDNSDWVMGEDGVATVSAWSGVYKIEGKNPWEYEGEGNDMYQQEHDELFASIRNGEALNDGTFMAKSTLVAIMGRMAAYTGQTITWEQAMQSEQRLGPADYKWGEFEMNPVPIPGKTQFS